MATQPTSPTVPAQQTGRNQGGRIAAALLKYLTDRPGQAVFRAEIAEATGLTEAQIRVGMSNLRQANTLGAATALETVTSGQVWVWHGTRSVDVKVTEVKPSKRVFEEVGPVRDGSIIIQDEAGALYRATEM